jgi:8-oxo-dGTP diphosphatase
VTPPVDERWRSPEIERYVVGAVLLEDGKALVLERASDDFMGGTWELPSGRVEQGETLEQALDRELREEVGRGLAALGRYLGSFDYRSRSGKPTRQLNFVVTAKPGPIRLTEHSRFAWIGADGLGGLGCSPETREVLASCLAGEPAADA